MKQSIAAFLLVLSLPSCKNTWNDEDKAMLYQTVLENAKTWAGSPEKAKEYTDCVVNKIMQKYPNENDALAHMDSLMRDPDLKSCKAEIMKK